MAKVDTFTEKRMIKFIHSFRIKTGQLPTLKDFASDGFKEDQVDAAVKGKIIEQFYVTLTNGTIVKTYKVREYK